MTKAKKTINKSIFLLITIKYQALSLYELFVYSILYLFQIIISPNCVNENSHNLIFAFKSTKLILF